MVSIIWAALQVKKVGKVTRAIAIMSHPIPNTNDSHSAQVILPQKQLGRKSDMWVTFLILPKRYCVLIFLGDSMEHKTETVEDFNVIVILYGAKAGSVSEQFIW